MSILPEVILQNVLIRGIKDAREDDEVLDIIFRNASQKVVSNIKAIFKKVDINVFLNFPREDIKLPFIAILLRGEDEAVPYLGDLIGEGTGPGTVNGFAEAGTAARGSADSRIREEHFFLGGGVIDEISTSQVAQPTSTIIGEPRRLFVDDGVTFYKREGVGNRTSYLVQVAAATPQMVITLYALSKFIFIRNRMVLERNGLQEFQMSGTDFSPNPEYLPTYVYSRGLHCTFFNNFDYVLTQGKDGSLGYGDNEYFKGFDLDLCVLDPITGEAQFQIDVLSQPPSITSIAPNSISISTEITLIIDGVNICNGATVRFDDLPFDADAGPSGIEIRSVEFIDGQKLRVKVFPYTLGTTDVTVINPDLITDTLTGGLTVV